MTPPPHRARSWLPPIAFGSKWKKFPLHRLHKWWHNSIQTRNEAIKNGNENDNEICKASNTNGYSDYV